MQFDEIDEKFNQLVKRRVFSDKVKMITLLAKISTPFPVLVLGLTDQGEIVEVIEFTENHYLYKNTLFLYNRSSILQVEEKRYQSERAYYQKRNQLLIYFEELKK